MKNSKEYWGYAFYLDSSRRHIHVNLKPCLGTIINNECFKPNNETYHYPLSYVHVYDSMKDAISSYNEELNKEIESLHELVKEIERNIV